MASHIPIRKVVEPVIPDKLYFRIGDVARLCDVPAYVLRFWETEFAQLKPNKGGTGQRLYRRRDVEMALRIKSLLYDEGYTIPGARQALRASRPDAKGSSSASPAEFTAAGPQVVSTAPPQARTAALHALRTELQALAEMLAAPPAANSRSKVETMRPRAAADIAAAKPSALKPALQKPDAGAASHDMLQQDLF